MTMDIPRYAYESTTPWADVEDEREAAIAQWRRDLREINARRGR